MSRMRESGHEGTGTSPLVGRLAISSRIGEFLVIEYPIGIQSIDCTSQSVEMEVFQGLEFLWKTLDGTEFEVITSLSVLEVDAKFGTVNIERHFFFLGLVLVSSEQVFHIEGIAQENPTPTEVNAQFSTKAGREIKVL